MYELMDCKEHPVSTYRYLNYVFSLPSKRIVNHYHLQVKDTTGYTHRKEVWKTTSASNSVEFQWRFHIYHVFSFGKDGF